MTRRTLRRTRRSSRRKERSHRVVGHYEDENGPIARGGVACPFPWRLHDMLAYTEEQNLEDVVSWDEEGNGFSVYETDSFVEQILPSFFSQTKFASFQRQLNLYGFTRRPTRQNGHTSYYHPCFVKGKRQLVRNMVRCKVKGTGKARTVSFDKSHPYSNFKAQSADESTEGPGNSMAHDQADDLSIDVWQSTSPLAELIPTPVTPLSSKFTVKDVFGGGNGSEDESSSKIHDGDLLFFEGTPFRYLDTDSGPDCIESASPVPFIPLLEGATPCGCGSLAELS